VLPYVGSVKPGPPIADAQATRWFLPYRCQNSVVRIIGIRRVCFNPLHDPKPTLIAVVDYASAAGRFSH
jgi:hypothetical protein